MIGLDTGFFFRLIEGSNAAIELLDVIILRDERAAVSTVTLYEVLKHGFRGSLPHAIAQRVVEISQDAFTSAGIDDIKVLDRAARLSHGTGLGMADSLIAASLEAVQCTELHTTDNDFDRYVGGLQIVKLLS